MTNNELIKESMTPSIAATLLKFVKPVVRKLGKTETGKYLRKARKVYVKKGFQKSLTELSKTKDVGFNLGKKIPQYFDTPKTLTEGTGAGKFIRKQIGNTASLTQTLTKGVPEAGWHATIIASKNLMQAMGRNIKSSRFKTVSAAPSKGKFFNKTPIDKSKLKVGDTYGKIFKKKVVGIKKGPKGNELLVRKSIPGQAFGVAMSAPAFGGYTYAANKDEKMPKRVGKSVADAALWTVAPTATFAGTLLHDQLKRKKTKKVSGGNL